MLTENDKDFKVDIEQHWRLHFMLLYVDLINALERHFHVDIKNVDLNNSTRKVRVLLFLKVYI